ncbi:perilipin-5-like [Eriocheir sinensis]|uniref:perilipin-5-like n=1 Tax=Eriocheir sinensis TaxID=95602 RepID=UPI0021C619B5|nr:perilipin-5-like [Eriocheir sinensis]
MTPKASSPHPSGSQPRQNGTPVFLARVMALPALSKAIDTFYDTGKSNAVVGAALRAAERGVRVAATGALPLADPLVRRVGGWAVVDEWACRGLDRVEKAVPIINLPAEEIVDRTRRTVLATVAGDQVIVPPTLLEAVQARANKLVDRVSEGPVMSKVAVVAEGYLDSAEGYLDTLLPRGKGDRRQSLAPGEGVLAKARLLGQRTTHRLYRVAIRRMRPDLSYDPKAKLTLEMVVNYTRTTILDQLVELARHPEPNENFGLVMSAVRLPIRLTSDTITFLLVTYEETSARVQHLVQLYLPRVTLSASTARASATEAARRVTDLLSPAGAMREQVMASLTSLTASLKDAPEEFRARLREILDTLAASLPLEARQRVEVREWVQKALEEASMWGNAGLTALKMTPDAALYGSQLMRLFINQTMRNAVNPTSTTTPSTSSATTSSSSSPSRRSPNLVPVKVTLLKPKKRDPAGDAEGLTRRTPFSAVD